ncbi:hypothetical protein TNCV_3668681 [Trichonephila clavipes]|nr:hypothetical protein TNCV_3668681 [Trichonephila clavipes]
MVFSGTSLELMTYLPRFDTLTMGLPQPPKTPGTQTVKLGRIVALTSGNRIALTQPRLVIRLFLPKFNSVRYFRLDNGVGVKESEKFSNSPVSPESDIVGQDSSIKDSKSVKFRQIMFKVSFDIRIPEAFK